MRNSELYLFRKITYKVKMRYTRKYIVYRFFSLVREIKIIPNSELILSEYRINGLVRAPEELVTADICT